MQSWARQSFKSSFGLIYRETIYWWPKAFPQTFIPNASLAYNGRRCDDFKKIHLLFHFSSFASLPLHPSWLLVAAICSHSSVLIPNHGRFQDRQEMCHSDGVIHQPSNSDWFAPFPLPLLLPNHKPTMVPWWLEFPNPESEHLHLNGRPQWTPVFDHPPCFLLPSILLTIPPTEFTYLQPLEVTWSRAKRWSWLYLSQFCRSILSDSLWPHGLQHARLLCPLPTPRACSNSCALSQWCYPTISSSVIPFSSCLRSDCIYKCGNATLFDKPLLEAFLFFFFFL